MESWIKSKADQLAQAAQQQVNAVHQSASRLAEDVLEKVRYGPEEDYRKDLEFRDGPLGFTLEGSLVVAVETNSQAERLGVAVGDRLVRVDGYEVPDVESGGFEEQRARAQIAKWLKDMPRPGMLTFELPETFSDEEDAPKPEDGHQEEKDEAALAAKNTAVQVLQAELQRIQEERRKLSLELQENQEQRGALRAQVEQLQQKNDQQTRRVTDLEDQLQTQRTQNEELNKLQQALHSAEEANQAKVQALTMRDEASQTAIQAAESRAAAAEHQLVEQRQELKSTLAKLADAEAHATETRMQLEPLEKEVNGFRLAHEAELELLREEQRKHMEEHALQVKELEELLSMQQEEASKELKELRDNLSRCEEALVEAQADAEAASLEARASRMEAASKSASQAKGDGDDMPFIDLNEVPLPMARQASENQQVLGLQKRIDLLESRCQSLQRRLQSQESVSMAPSRPNWESKLANATGPEMAAVAVTLHRLLLGILRGFLERILKSEAWLWLFYAHLLVLYLIAASSSVRTSADAGSGAVESLNAQLASAGAGGAPNLRGGP
eukprot:symbB.v1.2.037073.t1/scaffold5376.1/size27864/2